MVLKRLEQGRSRAPACFNIIYTSVIAGEQKSSVQDIEISIAGLPEHISDFFGCRVRDARGMFFHLPDCLNRGHLSFLLFA